MLAIALAIVVALFMTVVSLKLYDMDYVSRLDVSLPSREALRAKTTIQEETKKFDASGPLDEQAFFDFQSIYTKNRTALDVLGKFDSDALNDNSLQVGNNE